MFPAPMMERREREQAGDEAPKVVRSLGFKERAVAAVVEDDKHSHQKAPGQNPHGQAQPPGNRESAIHQLPEQSIRTERITDLPRASWPRGTRAEREQLLSTPRPGQ